MKNVWFWVMDWVVIRRLCSSRITKGAVFWAFFVPLAANVLDNIPDEIQIPWFSSAEDKEGAEAGSRFGSITIPISLALPFSWQLSFYAAFLSFIAFVLCKIRCPEVIEEFRDFEEFEQSKMGPSDLYHLSHPEEKVTRPAVGKLSENSRIFAQDNDMARRILSDGFTASINYAIDRDLEVIRTASDANEKREVTRVSLQGNPPITTADLANLHSGLSGLSDTIRKRLSESRNSELSSQYYMTIGYAKFKRFESRAIVSLLLLSSFGCVGWILLSVLSSVVFY